MSQIELYEKAELVLSEPDKATTIFKDDEKTLVNLDVLVEALNVVFEQSQELYSEDAQKLLRKELIDGYNIFRPRNKKLRAAIAAFNVRVGYRAYKVVEQLKKERESSKNKLVATWMRLYSKACGVSFSVLYRYKTLCEQFLTYHFPDGRSFIDLLVEDSEDAIAEFFYDYFQRNPDLASEAAYTWALGNMSQGVYDYVHTLFATRATIDLDKVQEFKERAKSQRLSPAQEKPLPLPPPLTINTTAQHVQSNGSVQTNLFDTVTQRPIRTVVAEEDDYEEKPFSLGTENIQQEQASVAVATPQAASAPTGERVNLETLRNKLETLEDEKAVLQRQVEILEAELESLEEKLQEKQSVEDVSREILAKWVEKSADYFFLQNVAVDYLRMAPSLEKLEDPVTGKRYVKDSLRRVILAQLVGD